MHTRLPRLAVAVAAVAGFLAHAPRASADYILDSFNNPSPGTIYQISLLNGNPYTSPATTVSPGVSRTVQVTVASTPVNFNSVSGTIGGGLMTMDSDNSSAAVAQITYTLTGAASNLSGATGLQLSFNRLDAGLTGTGNAPNIPASVQVVTSTGTLTLNPTTLPNSALPFSQGFDFSSFSGTGNLGQVSSITFVLNGRLNNSGGLNTNGSRSAVDFSLDDVSVRGPNPVPAPPALLLAGIGALALLGRARLTRKKPVAA